MARAGRRSAASGLLRGRERRVTRDPILPLTIFRIPGLAAANLTGLIGFAGMLSMFYFLTIYMQNVLGYSPITAGAAYLPLTFVIGISAGVGSKLLTRVGTRAVISVGALIAAGGLLLLSRIGVGGGYGAHILPGLLLFALGVGPVFVGVTTAANAGVGPSRAGTRCRYPQCVPADRRGPRAGHLLCRRSGANASPPGERHPDPECNHVRAARCPAHRRRLRRCGQRARARTKNAHEDPAQMAAARVLIVGRSPSVLLEAVELLRARGFQAEATNQFDRVLDDYDMGEIDIVVFGGMVPAETKESLRAEISYRNPAVTFVQGLAGIAGVIAAQIESMTRGEPVATDITYDDAGRILRVGLAASAHVAVEAYWITSFASGEPASTSMRLTDGRLAAGIHDLAVPDRVPSDGSFVAVTVDSQVHVLAIGDMPEAVRRLAPASTTNCRLPAVAAVTTHDGRQPKLVADVAQQAF